MLVQSAILPRENLPLCPAFQWNHSCILPSDMSFGIYLLGIILVIAGLVYAAAIVHAPIHWIIVAALVMLGAGVVAAVKATRQRDPAD